MTISSFPSFVTVTATARSRGVMKIRTGVTVNSAALPGSAKAAAKKAKVAKVALDRKFI